MESKPEGWSQQALIFAADNRIAPALAVQAQLSSSVNQALTALVEGLSEDEVYAGDHLRIGPVILKVTEPRTPCLKFNRRMGYAKAAKQMIQSGRSGWYCAVLQTGFVAAGELIELIPGRRLVSIADQLRMQQRSLERQIELF